MLLFIALFIWIGAAQEASMVQMKSALAGIPVSRTMLTDFKVLAPDDPLSRAIDLVLQGSQQDFPVVDDRMGVGVLTRAALLKSLAQQSVMVPVSALMQREFPAVGAGEMLETLFARLQECQCHTVPVTHRGVLVGMVTSENIGEFLMIQAALERHAESILLPGPVQASG